MKKQFAVVAAIAGLALGAAIAQGADSTGKGIVGSVHDLSGSAQGTSVGGVSDPGKRICAFCHSPHHSAFSNLEKNGAATTDDGLGNITPGAEVAYLDGNAAGALYNVYAPLWSRTMDKVEGYQQYVSQSFNPGISNKAYDALIGPSRLCLSCHDGSVALDAYYGKEGVTNNASEDLFNGPLGGGGVKSIAIAGNMGLGNDHPIGMKYTDFLGKTDTVNTYELMPTDTPFKSTSNANKLKISQVLYTDPMDSTNVKDFVTCASCHDVHNGNAVGNNAPSGGMRGFLLYGSQVNSSFCLTCHAKNGTNGVPAGN